MRRWTTSLILLLVATPVASAADVLVGGRGPHLRVHGHPPLRSEARPVFVVVDDFAFDVGGAPPLAIRVEGDVDVFVLPDGSMRFELRDDADGAGE